MSKYQFFSVLAFFSLVLFGCEETAGHSRPVEINSTRLAIDEEERFLYFLCNATGWNPDASTRLESTGEPGVYALEYSVSESSMVTGHDQCIVVETDTLNAWGTSQQWMGATTSDVIDAPDNWTVQANSSSRKGISYPTLGDYRAIVDVDDMTISIEAIDGTSPQEETYYYLRCNTTGWDVTDTNRLVSDKTTSLLTLDYTVATSWVVEGGDECVVTETNEKNGWGTVQTTWTLSQDSDGFDIPVDGVDEKTLIESNGNFDVDYPALGDYRALFDPIAKELTLGVPTEPKPDYGLNGEVEEIGNGRVRITYDFETAKQLEDWLPADPTETSVFIQDGRLHMEYIEHGGESFVAFLDRGLRVDSMTYETELLDGNHINIYIGTEWNHSWLPKVGFGLIHRWYDRRFTVNGEFFSVGGSGAKKGNIYTGEIIAESDEITWTVNDETFSIGVDYPNDVTRSLLIGGFSSNTAFDNIIIEGELEPLD